MSLPQRRRGRKGKNNDILYDLYFFAMYLYGEDQNHETSFKGKALQAVVDSWCKIQVLVSKVFEIYHAIEALKQIIVVGYCQQGCIMVRYTLEEQVQDAGLVIRVEIAGSFIRQE